MLDPAVRARLEEHCVWLLEYQPTLGDQEVASDIRAALAALDAATQALTSQKAHCQRIAEAFEGAVAELDAATQARAAAERVAHRAVTWRDEHGPGSLQALSDAITAWKEQQHAPD